MSPEGSSPAVDVRFSLIRWGNRRIEALFTAFLATAPTPDTRRIVEFVPFFWGSATGMGAYLPVRSAVGGWRRLRLPLPCRGILIRRRAGFSVPARFGGWAVDSRPRFGFRVLEFSGYPPAPRPPTQQFNGFFWKKLGGCFIGFSRSLAGAGIWRYPVASHHARGGFGAG